MTPLEFLREEVANVRSALNETLRHDYAPGQGREYYAECANRLSEIDASVANTPDSDFRSIQALFNELRQLSSWIQLIERSHLGEFSWPFAEELKEIAIILLSETNMQGKPINPLIHVVAEADGYQIQYEAQTSTASSGQPFVVIAFQRSLKHHALFHCLFGHELCHAALQTSAAGAILNSDVVTALESLGPLSSAPEINKWAKTPTGSTIEDYFRESWLEELTCDLFGLVLFGPAFLAAHRTYLRPLEHDPHHIDYSGPTHPPYAVRHKMLRRAMELVGWDKSITGEEFERELLSYVLDDPYSSDAIVFDDKQLNDAIAGVKRVITSLVGLAYSPLASDELKDLVSKLARHVPPVSAQIDTEGKIVLGELSVSQILYVGWCYWIGQAKLTSAAPLNFFQTNRLCDLALLQQRAVSAAKKAGVD